MRRYINEIIYTFYIIMHTSTLEIFSLVRIRPV